MTNITDIDTIIAAQTIPAHRDLTRGQRTAIIIFTIFAVAVTIAYIMVSLQVGNAVTTFSDGFARHLMDGK